MAALNDRHIVVLGAGLAGLATALSLAGMGARVTVLEKGDFSGGHATLIGCKALENCQKCNGCLSEDIFARAFGDPDVRIISRAEVSSCEEEGDGYNLKVEITPPPIDPVHCTQCGKCLEICPRQDLAFKRPELLEDVARLAIDAENCLYYQGSENPICAEVCPEEAMDFAREAQVEEMRADAVVLATGFRPFDAAEKPRLGYGKDGVITALELERDLKSATPRYANRDNPPKRVGFVQCVGSRDVTGHNYCSRVCCQYGLRLARVMAHRFGSEVSFFYIDLQSFGHDFDGYLAQADEELKLIRTLPGDVDQDKDGLSFGYSLPGESPGKAEVDLLVLSVGMCPNPDNRRLADTFGLELDEHGFLRGGSNGVVLAGTSLEPMNMNETVASAGRAAAQIAARLGKGVSHAC